MEFPTGNIDSFIESTRDVIYLRDVDRIMIIRPNKIQHLNGSAYEMLNSVYHMKMSPQDTVDEMSNKYGIPSSDLMNDLVKLLESISAIMKDDYSKAFVETIDFDPGSIKFPVLSEIALTYRCQNMCDFCYASSPFRGKAGRGDDNRSGEEYY